MSRKLQNGSLFTNVTALNPIIGYKASSKVAKEAHATGRLVYDIVIEQGLLSKEGQIRFYADKLNVSPAYLSRLVKEISGSTINEHATSLVYKEICNLLTQTDMSMGEIAAHLNFSDQSAMTNFFKQRSGMSPLAYMNK